jgi:hypothetical protein
MMARVSAISKGELHFCVTNLALSFHLNYGMVYPALSDVLMMTEYAHELGLPSRLNETQI